MRQRTQVNKATYACFFDAAKAYASVPHALLLHRLLQCGVSGPAFAVLAAMYSSASSRVRVRSPLSPAFEVRRGVAQGCPLSPLLYAIFVDPVLRDMPALSQPDLLWVGPVATRRKLVGQAYAGWHSCNTARPATSCTRGPLAQPSMGLVAQCAQINCYGVRTQSMCARLGAPELWWGDSRLPTADTEKYLGLRLESSGGWASQQAAGAANG